MMRHAQCRCISFAAGSCSKFWRQISRRRRQNDPFSLCARSISGKRNFNIPRLAHGLRRRGQCLLKQLVGGVVSFAHARHLARGTRFAKTNSDLSAVCHRRAQIKPLAKVPC